MSFLGVAGLSTEQLMTLQDVFMSRGRGAVGDSWCPVLTLELRLRAFIWWPRLSIRQGRIGEPETRVGGG